MLTAESLREVLHYNQVSGLFSWSKPTGSRSKVGSVAGTIGSQGYVLVKIFGQQYRAHRLAWLYVYGQWPENQIDHINGVRWDNRICNLRKASNEENQQNARRRKIGASGFVGVDWCKKSRKWRARIKKGGKPIHIGLYDLLEDAVWARNEAKKAYHPFAA